MHEYHCYLVMLQSVNTCIVFDEAMHSKLKLETTQLQCRSVEVLDVV